MATLVRDKSERVSEEDANILSSVPSPFPVDQLHRSSTPENPFEDANAAVTETEPAVANLEAVRR